MTPPPTLTRRPQAPPPEAQRIGRISAALLLAMAPMSAPAAGQAQGQVEDQGSAVEGPAGWSLGDGLRAEAGPLRLRVRPRFHLDLVEPEFERIGDALGKAFEPARSVRRARLLTDLGFAETSSLSAWSLRAQLDFASLDLDWKDLFVRYEGLPLPAGATDSDLRFGQFREPFGLEAMSSVSHIPFIERSIATNTFTPGRGRGAQWSGRWPSAILQAGWFRAAEGEPFPDDLGEETAATVRAAWLGDGPGLLQAGGSLSLRDAGTGTLRLSARPGTRLLPPIVDTSDLDADNLTTAGVEALWSRDGWTLVAEAFGAWVNTGAGQGFLSGGHVWASCFLDGSSRTGRRRRRGSLGPPSVPDVWRTREEGNGAVEAVARLSGVHLDDGPVSGGRAVDLELGLNWYLTPGTRVLLHWAGTRISGSSSSANGSAILARLQVQL